MASPDLANLHARVIPGVQGIDWLRTELKSDKPVRRALAVSLVSCIDEVKAKMGQPGMWLALFQDIDELKSSLDKESKRGVRLAFADLPEPLESALDVGPIDFKDEFVFGVSVADSQTCLIARFKLGPDFNPSSSAGHSARCGRGCTHAH